MNRYILNNTGPTEFYRNGPYIHDKIEFLEWVNSHFTVVYTPNPTPFPRNHTAYISKSGNVHFFDRESEGWDFVETGSYCGINANGEVLVVEEREFRDSYMPYILKNTGPTEFYRNGPHIHDRIDFLEWVESHFTVVYTPNPTPFPRNHTAYISKSGNVHFFDRESEGWDFVETGSYCGINANGEVLVVEEREFRDSYMPYILKNTGPTEFYRNGPHIHDRIDFLEWVESHFTVVYTPNPISTKDGGVLKEHKVNTSVSKRVLDVEPLPDGSYESDPDPVHISYVSNVDQLVCLGGFEVGEKFKSFVIYDIKNNVFYGSVDTLFTCTGETLGDVVYDIFIAAKPRFQIHIRG